MPGHKLETSSAKLSRRDFARGVALAAATSALPQTAIGHASETAQEARDQASQLSAAAEAQVQSILAKYGKRLSDEQKVEIRRLVAQAQKSSEALRSFALDNSNEPALTFRIYRSGR